MSLKTPIVNIYDSSKKPITYQGRNLNEYLTKFRYTYIEGPEGDECVITFEFDVKGYMDIPAINKRSRIFVEWGYIGQLSRLRDLGIKDTEVKYDPDNLQYTLLCLSWAEFLTEDVSDKTNMTTLFQELLDKVKKGLEFKVKLPENIETMKVAWEKGLLFKKDDKPPQRYMPRSTLGGYYNLDLADPITGDNTFMGSVRDMDKYANFIGLPITAALDYWVQFDPTLYIDTRDNGVTIQGKQLYGPVTRSYEWRKGEGTLLSISLSTEDRKSKNNSETVITIDGLTKEVLTVKVGAGSVETELDKKYYFSYASPFGFDNDQVVYKYEGGRFYVFNMGQEDSALLVADNKRTEELKRDLEKAIKLQKLKTEGIKVTEQAFYDDMANSRDKMKTPTPINSGGFNIEQEEYWAIRQAEIDGTIYNDARFNTTNWFEEHMLSSSPHSKEDLVNMLTRRSIQNELARNQGELTVIGDPILTSGIRITLDGLASQHNGSYYIEEATHSIGSDGYKTELLSVKVPRAILSTKAYWVKKVDGEWENILKEAVEHNRGEWLKVLDDERDPLGEYVEVDQTEVPLLDADSDIDESSSYPEYDPTDPDDPDNPYGEEQK